MKVAGEIQIAMGRTILIGDVHGCREELESLLKAVDYGRDDGVVLVGDLVAKGPDSQGVVQLSRENGFRSVMGNHDAHVLKLRAGKLDKPPKPAHQQVAKSLSEADWAFLEQLPPWLRLADHGVIAVHGGLMPGVPLEKQDPDLAMNLRSITPDGKPSKKVDAGVPWASAWRGPEQVVFGHDAIRGLQQHPHATGIDTACVYGRSLTALILPEKRLVSVRAKRQYSEPGA